MAKSNFKVPIQLFSNSLLYHRRCHGSPPLRQGRRENTCTHGTCCTEGMTCHTCVSQFTRCTYYLEGYLHSLLPVHTDYLDGIWYPGTARQSIALYKPIPADHFRTVHATVTLQLVSSQIWKPSTSVPPPTPLPSQLKYICTICLHPLYKSLLPG